MTAKKENAAIVGVGVAACAVCCAGPILGVLSAIGLGSAAGFALFGSIALVIGAAVAAFVVLRRRRRFASPVPAEGSAPPTLVEVYPVTVSNSTAPGPDR
jgi:Na+/melibiose symporter-like transporter